jgi:hypothetical protein
MNARSQLAGLDRFLSLRDSTLRIGIFTGVTLSAVFTAWLLIANRVPQFERFATLRNLAAAGTLLVLMSIPVLRFLASPVRMFVSGTVGWALASLCYVSMEMYFPRLDSRMGALHVFMLGAIAYGFLAVLDWVVNICRLARRQPIVAARRRSL